MVNRSKPNPLQKKGSGLPLLSKTVEARGERFAGKWQKRQKGGNFYYFSSRTGDLSCRKLGPQCAHIKCHRAPVTICPWLPSQSPPCPTIGHRICAPPMPSLTTPRVVDGVKQMAFGFAQHSVWRHCVATDLLKNAFVHVARVGFLLNSSVRVCTVVKDYIAFWPICLKMRPCMWPGLVFCLIAVYGCPL